MASKSSLKSAKKSSKPKPASSAKKKSSKSAASKSENAASDAPASFRKQTVARNGLRSFAFHRGDKGAGAVLGAIRPQVTSTLAGANAPNCGRCQGWRQRTGCRDSSPSLSDQRSGK